MKDKAQKIIGHPMTILLAILGGLVTALTQLGSQLQQIGWQLGPLAYQLPKSQHFLIEITVASAACSFVAGIGHLILQFTNQKGQNGS